MRGEDHAGARRRAGHAAAPTPPRISTVPSSRSGPSLSSSQTVESSRPAAGVSEEADRGHHDRQCGGRLHHAPGAERAGQQADIEKPGPGGALPMSERLGEGCRQHHDRGQCEAPGQQFEHGPARRPARTAIIASAQHSPAPSRKTWPASTPGRDQSIAHGPIITTTPASPKPAATQRRSGIASRSSSSDSGTIQIVVVFAKYRRPPRRHPRDGRMREQEEAGDLQQPDAEQGGQIGAPGQAQPAQCCQQQHGREARERRPSLGEPKRRRAMLQGHLGHRPGRAQQHHGAGKQAQAGRRHGRGCRPRHRLARRTATI